MATDHFAAAATWRRLLHDYYRELVDEDAPPEPPRPVRPDDQDVEIEPEDPGSFTGGNPTAASTEPGHDDETTEALTDEEHT